VLQLQYKIHSQTQDEQYFAYLPTPRHSAFVHFYFLTRLWHTFVRKHSVGYSIHTYILRTFKICQCLAYRTKSSSALQ